MSPPRENNQRERRPLAQTRYDVLAARPFVGIVWQILPSGRRMIAIDARPETCCSDELPCENLSCGDIPYEDLPDIEDIIEHARAQIAEPAGTKPADTEPAGTEPRNREPVDAARRHSFTYEVYLRGVPSDLGGPGCGEPDHGAPDYVISDYQEPNHGHSTCIRLDLDVAPREKDAHGDASENAPDEYAPETASRDDLPRDDSLGDAPSEQDARQAKKQAKKRAQMRAYDLLMQGETRRILRESRAEMLGQNATRQNATRQNDPGQNAAGENAGDHAPESEIQALRRLVEERKAKIDELREQNRRLYQDVKQAQATPSKEVRQLREQLRADRAEQRHRERRLERRLARARQAQKLAKLRRDLQQKRRQQKRREEPRRQERCSQDPGRTGHPGVDDPGVDDPGAEDESFGAAPAHQTSSHETSAGKSASSSTRIIEMLLDAALSKDGLLAKILQLQGKEPRKTQPQQKVMRSNPTHDPVPGSDNPGPDNSCLKNPGPGDRPPDSQVYPGKSPSGKLSSGKSSAASTEAEASGQGASLREPPKREGPERSQPGQEQPGQEQPEQKPSGQLPSGQPPSENDGPEGKSARESPSTRDPA